MAECLREVARATLQDFDHTGVQRLPMHQGGLQFGSLLAAPLDGAAQLIEFGSLDFQTEIKKDQLHFVSWARAKFWPIPFSLS
jgi:hypothetical protein